MPGIVGLITKLPRQRAEPELFRMIEALRHESFYVTGTLIDESLGLYLGWVARKNSFSEEMPLRNEQGDIVLVFSGEEFPEAGTAHQLRQGGHELNQKGPSYLVHLYEEARSFPAGLNGRFQGLVADQARGTMMLFNDRYGMHRLYYHESKESFYFAAEAKSILAVRPELRRADPKGLGEFVACGCVLENRTLFQGIQVLPPGSAWNFQGGALVQKSSYFDPHEWEKQTPLDPESYYEELRNVFSRNLGRYFEGQERVGMSLTGGLDSRMIMAWLKPSPGSLPCYTFGDGGGRRQCRDVVVAQQVASACEQVHEVIPVGDEFLSRFSHYAERTVYLSDGCVDLTHSPDLYLNERARQIAPVRMTGNYGSEVLRRAVAFKPGVPAAGLFHPDFVPNIDAAGPTYAALLQGHPVSFAVFRQAPWHHYGLLALEETQLSLRSPYLDNDLVRTVFRAPKSALGDDVCLRLIADGDAGLRQIRTDRGLNGNNRSLSAVAHRSLLEFFFKAEYAYDSGMPQWAARIDHLLSPLHPERLFLGWHKFHHFRIWYRDSLSRYVREMLLDPRSLARAYVEPRQVEAVVEGHLKGNRNYTAEIHKLLTLELIHRVLLDLK
jgi:asparagine synthase (glutamine-hydrolysing)